MATFPSLFFLTKYRPEKSLLRYSTTKKRLSRLSKKRTSKTQKIDFFPKGLTHGFGQKMATFPSLFFLTKYTPENLFYDILERKNAFLDYQKKELQKLKKNFFFQRG